MSNTDSKRIFSPEGPLTFRGKSLDQVLRELDMRVFGSNCFSDITRTAGLITKVEYYDSIGRTHKVAEKQITYTSGLITLIVMIFFNMDDTEDSRITHTITRVNGKITACDSVFSTTEDLGC